MWGKPKAETLVLHSSCGNDDTILQQKHEKANIVRTPDHEPIVSCYPTGSDFKLLMKENEDQDYFSHKHKCYTNIFFTETSGSADILTARQACPVEAAALRNNYSKIQVWMFTTKSVIDTFNLKRIYPNINIICSNFDNFFEDTFLEKWYQEGKWNESEFRVTHLSDAVRYVLVSKFGGVYLDLDAIVLKPLRGLRNFVIKESRDVLCNGIFGLDSNHQLLSSCLKQFTTSYDKDYFPCVGPDLVTKSFKTLYNIAQSRKAENYSNLSTLPEITAFPVSWYQWKDYFEESKANYVMRSANKSYVAHLFNKFSIKQKLSLGSGSAYEEIMKVNCPVVYKTVLRTSKTL